MTGVVSKRILFLRIAAVTLVGCSSATQNPSSGTGAAYASSPNNVQLNLTDAPNADAKSVIVNVDHAELVASREGKEGRLILAQNLGPVDLLTLQNGLTLAMGALNLKSDTVVEQIRLVLRPDGNQLVHVDGSICNLQTPSGQQSGIKFVINGGLTIETGYSYSIVADFDAEKSIVIQGNGGCLLKPVLKLKSASRISGESAGAVEEPVASSGDSTQVSDGSGFESGSEGTSVPVVSPESM